MGVGHVRSRIMTVRGDFALKVLPSGSLARERESRGITKVAHYPRLVLCAVCVCVCVCGVFEERESRETEKSVLGRGNALPITQKL